MNFDIISSFLPGKEADLLTSIMMGGKSTMVVFSGMCIMMTGKLIIEFLAEYFGRKWAIIVGLILVWSYVLSVNLSISIVRATLMLTLIYWAQLLGKKFDVSRAVVLVLIIILVSNYKALFEWGFWLTLAAFIGIYSNWNRNILWQSFWINLWTMPIIILMTGKISIFSIFLNTLMFLTVEYLFIIGLVGLITRVGIVFWLAWPILKIIANFNLYQLSIGWNLNFLIGWYLVLTGYFLKRR